MLGTEETRQFLLKTVGEKKIAEERWLCKDLIYQNSICILDSSNSSEKSYLALQLAVSFITQKSFLLSKFKWSEGRNKKVAYITTKIENPIEIVSNRLLQICEIYNLDDFDIKSMINNLKVIYLPHFFITNSETQLITVTEVFKDIADYIRENKIELAIIDPIAQFFLIDMNSNERIVAIYEKLQNIPTTWFLVHNQTKYSKDKNTENTTYRGASAIRDIAQLRLTVGKRNIPQYRGPVTDLFIDKANFSQYNQHHIFLSLNPPFELVSKEIWPHSTFMSIEELKNTKKKTKNIKRHFGFNKLDDLEYEDYDDVDLA